VFVLWISGDGIVVLDEVGCVRPMYVCLLCCGCVLGSCFVKGLGLRLFKVSISPIVVHCSAILFWLCLLLLCQCFRCCVLSRV